MKRILSASIAMFMMAICLAARSQELRKIELRMSPGESHSYTTHAETSTQYVAHRYRGNEERLVVFKSDMTVEVRCVGAPAEGLFDVEIVYPEFTMETTMTQGGQTSKIVTDRNGARSYLGDELQDSATWDEIEKEGNPNLLKLFSSRIGFTLDKTGRVIAVRAPENLTARLPGVDIKQFFQHQVIFPGIAIAPGAQWNQAAEREVPRSSGPLSRQIVVDETVYKYVGNEEADGRQCARISMEVTTKPKEAIPDLEKFEQTTKGLSLLALDTGQLVRSELKLSQEMRGTFGGIKTEIKTTGAVKTSLAQPAPSPAKTPSEEEKPPTETK